MQEAHSRAVRFGFFPFVLGVFFIAPSVSGAAILYGPDAHKKDYIITSTFLPSASLDGWERFGNGALGIFLAVTKDGTANLLSPEILILPCAPERPCVSLSLEDPSTFTKVFSFLHTADTLAIDAQSATDLETLARSLCSPKEKGLSETPYRASLDVVMEDSLIHKELRGTGCDLTYPKKRADSFIFRIFARGILNI